MESKDLDEVFRILKTNKVLAGEVAKAMSLSEGYISKIKNKKRGLTRQNLEGFNKKFGHLVKLDASLISEPEEKPDSTEYVRAHTVEDLTAKLLALQELVLNHHAEIFSVSHEAAQAALGKKLVAQLKKVKK